MTKKIQGRLTGSTQMHFVTVNIKLSSLKLVLLKDRSLLEIILFGVIYQTYWMLFLSTITTKLLQITPLLLKKGIHYTGKGICASIIRYLLYLGDNYLFQKYFGEHMHAVVNLNLYSIIQPNADVNKNILTTE